MVKECYRKDAYFPVCARIREHNRKDPRFKALFHQNLSCAACAEDHPVALFSALQRRETDDSRICVGHEGDFRVCQHRTITWLDVQEWRKALARLSAYGVSNFTGEICKHSDHLHQCHFLKLNGLKLELIGGPRHMTIILSTKLYHRPLGQRPLSLDVRRALAAAQEVGGKYLGPLAQHGTSTYMALFDPNNCLCLVYPGSELVEVPLAEPDPIRCRDNVVRSGISNNLGRLHLGSLSYSHLINYQLGGGSAFRDAKS